MTDDFQDIACPTPPGIEASLRLLRRADEPFSDTNLADRRDLLFLPFLRDIATVEQRIDRLKVALELATDHLPSRAYEVVYRGIFLEPRGSLSDRRKALLAELARLFPEKQDNESPSVKGAEERMISKLTQILLNPEFEMHLDEVHPKPRRISTATPLHAFRSLITDFACEIDDSDYRRMKVLRSNTLEILLPDQLVAPIRYNTDASNPLPVKDTVEVLSAGHTYLGTLPDRKDGAVASWMLQFVHLGTRKDPGDVITIDMRQEFFDEDQNEPHFCVTLTIDIHPLSRGVVSMRLPEGKLGEAKPERRAIANPHSNATIVEREALPIDGDGWIRTEFTDLKLGHQYGIYLRDFDLYK
jgi:hypothetical protein